MDLQIPKTEIQISPIRSPDDLNFPRPISTISRCPYERNVALIMLDAG
jgi:hypothetical protein